MRHRLPWDDFAAVYSVPAGNLQKNESAAEGASRILRTETGFIAYPKHLIQLPRTYTSMVHGKHHKRIYHLTLFTTRYYTNDMHFGEIAEPEWVPVAKIDSLKAFPLLSDMVNDVVKTETHASHWL